MYGKRLAEVYELIYRSRGKDWDAEAAEVTRLIRGRQPAADSLLDVACGTGAHLESFCRHFARAEGLEIAAPMRELAERRRPHVPVRAGDMRSFELGRRFDAVTCLFCAIALVGTVAELRATVRRMAAHLNPGGVLVIEPWWFPDQFIDGYVAGDLAREDGRTVARVSHSTRVGRATRMEVRFLVGDSTGVSEFTEIDVFALFTKDEYLAACADAGCPASYLGGGLTGRGLFVGVRV